MNGGKKPTSDKAKNPKLVMTLGEMINNAEEIKRAFKSNKKRKGKK